MKNWSLNRKIWSIIGGLALAFIFSTSFSLYSLMGLRDSLTDVTGNVVKRDQLTSEIKDNQRRISTNSAEAIIFTKPEQFKANQKTFEELMDKQDKDVKSYEALASEKGRALLKEYMISYEAYLTEMKKVRVFAYDNKNVEASNVYINARETLIPPMRKNIEALNDLTGNQLAEKSVDANTSANRAIWLGIAISGCSIFLSLLVSFFVLRALTGAIAEIVRGLSDSSAQVTSAATQIASASEELSQATTEQAASLEETAASVEEMNSMVAKNSENASSAAESSSASQRKALEGKSIVERMTQSMKDINLSNNAIMNQVNQSNESMAGIVKVIEQIDKKTKVINEIVNKTELLSFNASVEAARAGEHGKGFAVVAEEVGNLARMSGAAAEEIGNLLEESINKVNQIVHETKSSVEKLINEGKETVESGTKVALQCGAVFEEVVHNVTHVSGMATEIASASQEQSRGCTEITKAMSQLDQMTQQNAATSEECASAAEELSAQAESLKGAVTQLVFTVNGSDGKAQDENSYQAPSHSQAGLRKSVKSQPVASNVVRLKSPKGKSATYGDGAEPQFKKASGDTPDYDSSGFNDV